MEKLVRIMALFWMAGWMCSGSLYADSTSPNSWLQDIEGFANQVASNENLSSFSGTGGGGPSSNVAASGSSGSGAQKTTKKKKSKKTKLKKGGSKTKKTKAKKSKKKKSKKTSA